MSTSGERSLTILQVSDMRFGRHHQFPQETEAPPNEFDTLLERIWDDIKKLRDESISTPTSSSAPATSLNGRGRKSSPTHSSSSAPSPSDSN
jgi:hypothetical protein